ncbi:MAG: DinB family protein [Ginsengibacter sp.]
MTSIAEALVSLIEEYMPQLDKIAGDEFSKKTAPGKWSKKEMIGHLADSAQNNIRRFIVAQYEDTPTIVYNQDEWVTLNNYQQQPPQHVVQLWYVLNKQVAAIFKKISPGAALRQSQSQELHTIEWLGQDYLKHLKHHMHVVLDLEPVAYP